MDNEQLFCHDLPSKPQPEMGKILVAGASGYIGGRLVPELLARGYQVRAMVRAASPEYRDLWPGAEIAVADALEIDAVRLALAEVHTAYYLLHSLHLGPAEFEATDLKAAANFRTAAQDKQVKRLIYLGGLGDIRSPLSSHLRSRIAVAEELKRGQVPVTVLRAAIIIGSGSASYEIIQHLVRRVPIVPVPYWAKNRCQPIAVRDVVKYLVGALETPATSGRSLDVGGKDVLTYEKMMKILAEVLQKKRVFMPVFFSNMRLFAYVVSLVTPVPDPITRCLMEGLTNEVVCQDDMIKELVPFEPISYREAIVRALTREEQDRVHTRWSDAYPPAHELALKLHELAEPPQYRARYSLVTEKGASSLFRSICRIGGREGWLRGTWMWRLRGWADRILLGVGSSRGRRSHSSLKINDVLDFWRIEDLQRDERLLLRAEMRLPGRAWLEFSIGKEGLKKSLSVTAHYQTQSGLGRLYWYLFLPFHHFIFKHLIERIEERSEPC